MVRDGLETKRTGKEHNSKYSLVFINSGAQGRKEVRLRHASTHARMHARTEGDKREMLSYIQNKEQHFIIITTSWALLSVGTLLLRHPIVIGLHLVC